MPILPVATSSSGFNQNAAHSLKWLCEVEPCTVPVRTVGKAWQENSLLITIFCRQFWNPAARRWVLLLLILCRAIRQCILLTT